MFKEEIKNLTPYDKYIIIVEDLKDSYRFANAEYQHGQFEIQFNNTEYANDYLEKINTRRNKLQRDYDLAMKIKANVNIETLDTIEKQLFDAENSLFIAIQELLKKMENFLSQHNIELSI